MRNLSIHETDVREGMRTHLGPDVSIESTGLIAVLAEAISAVLVSMGRSYVFALAGGVRTSARRSGKIPTSRSRLPSTVHAHAIDGIMFKNAEGH